MNVSFQALIVLPILFLVSAADSGRAQPPGQKGDSATTDTNTTQLEHAAVFLRIPHVRQRPNLCAPASASMALLHYGMRVDQVFIKQLAAAATKHPEFTGTYYVDLVNGLATKGVKWKRNPHPTTAEGYLAGLKTIRDSLAAGRPVIVDTNLAPNGHTMLVNGIDTRHQMISVIDPNVRAPGLRRYSFIEFERIWRSMTVDVRGSVLTFPPGFDHDDRDEAAPDAADNAEGKDG